MFHPRKCKKDKETNYCSFSRALALAKIVLVVASLKRSNHFMLSKTTLVVGKG